MTSTMNARGTPKTYRLAWLLGAGGSPYTAGSKPNSLICLFKLSLNLLDLIELSVPVRLLSNALLDRSKMTTIANSINAPNTKTREHSK